jgi:hypothetical protein
LYKYHNHSSSSQQYNREIAAIGVLSQGCKVMISLNQQALTCHQRDLTEYVVSFEMPQHRLQHYFAPMKKASSPPSGRDFLDLPRSVRKLVYEHVGLGCHFVDLNYSNLKVFPQGAYPETQDCRKLNTNGKYKLKRLDVSGLDDVWEIDDHEVRIEEYGKPLWGNAWGACQSSILVCKKIHEEVEVLIYARAVFRVCLGQPLGFARLWRMSGNALSHLGSLTIRLGVPKAVVENDGWSDAPAPTYYIGVSYERGKRLMKDWSSTLERLARSIKPGQLRLYLVFCAMALEDVKVVIDGMTQLPRLKDCGICVELHDETCWWKPNTVSGLLNPRCRASEYTY